MKHRQFSVKKPANGGLFSDMVRKITLLTMVGLMMWGGIAAILPSQPVAANYYEQRIAKLRNEISNYSKRAKELAEQVDSLSNAIALLQVQQDSLLAEINLNKAKIDELKNEIAINEVKLEEQGAVLGDTLVDMHLDKRITPLEILASSKNLSDYVDKQAQQATVKEQVNSSIQRINELKKLLQNEKATVEKLLADQENRYGQLASMKQQQKELLSATQGQEETYKKLTAKNKKEIERLQAEQVRINQSSTGGGTVVAGDPNRGGYPAYLNNARKDALVDPWGMYNRECVSYVAWKVHQNYGNMPYWGGIGNANQWLGNAARFGIPYGSTPKPGSVAAFNGGRWGHVAWVESVNDNGTINLSEYNWGGDGLYHERYGVAVGSVSGFIYFGEWRR
ncbi:MAG: CHAP domain-containing protein [Candidatus Nomurabacteria bacterium]|jgi:surface antigen|nr:CHAP domain-containing protein [Candidatus Nomurabacteria bacterium]